MEACEIKVTLGNTVWAFNVYALLCIRFIRFFIGARGIASGRRPSIDRISTRCARAAGVGVKVSAGVSVSVAVAVSVGIGEGVAVDVMDGVGVTGTV